MNHFKKLLKLAKKETSYTVALSYLEEAHILSQPKAFPHLQVHFRMFLLALRHKEIKEVLGQIPRLILAIPGSLLGLAPKGNVGSTKMGIFEIKK